MFGIWIKLAGFHSWIYCFIWKLEKICEMCLEDTGHHGIADSEDSDQTVYGYKWTRVFPIRYNNICALSSDTDLTMWVCRLICHNH